MDFTSSPARKLCKSSLVYPFSLPETALEMWLGHSIGRFRTGGEVGFPAPGESAVCLVNLAYFHFHLRALPCIPFSRCMIAFTGMRAYCVDHHHITEEGGA